MEGEGPCEIGSCWMDHGLTSTAMRDRALRSQVKVTGFLSTPYLEKHFILLGLYQLTPVQRSVCW